MKTLWNIKLEDKKNPNCGAYAPALINALSESEALKLARRDTRERFGFFHSYKVSVSKSNKEDKRIKTGMMKEIMSEMINLK